MSDLVRKSTNVKLGTITYFFLLLTVFLSPSVFFPLNETIYSVNSFGLSPRSIDLLNVFISTTIVATSILGLLFNKKNFLKVSGIALLLSMPLNASHIEPYLVCYASVLLISLAYYKDEKAQINTFMFVQGLIVFWAGVHKINPSYIANIANDYLKFFPHSPELNLFYGWFSSIFEVFLGLALLLHFRYKNNIIVFLTMGVHFFNIFFIFAGVIKIYFYPIVLWNWYFLFCDFLILLKERKLAI